MVEFYFNKLSQLVVIVKQHVRNYLTEIFALIKDYWSSNQVTIIALIKALGFFSPSFSSFFKFSLGSLLIKFPTSNHAIAYALEGEFKIYLPQLLPLLLQVFETDDSEKRQPTLEVLTAFKRFGATLEEYLHLVLPVVVRLFEKAEAPMPLRKVFSFLFISFRSPSNYDSVYI